ncbi:MAG: hypothetical protein CBE33_04035 [Candidatus Pelagibacter sp. TMED273]|nr:MAG: hypothetical protein CBE33_04035 [Candidatus Pelagibacter sp. TMED273]|tara:strand:- start:3081 stop:4142 length:1062 start_codon:yes stop_codon:yes gene_type:complete
MKNKPIVKNILIKNSYDMNKIKKKIFFINEINKLNHHHFKYCANYRKISFLNKFKKFNKVENFPMLPTRLFKKYNLKSTNSNIVKVMKSSGTSGKSSKINLDQKNAFNQTFVLKKLFQENFGNKRFPMLIIDKNIHNKKTFDASMAAITGFSIFGKDHTFALDDQGKLDYKNIEIFFNKNKYETKFLFGFTSKVYEHLIKIFDNKKFHLNLKKDFLLHGGGWKKLEKYKISNHDFKNLLKKKFNIRKVINYYGMVEQAGSIFFECEKNNYFHTSNFSEILIRDKELKLSKKKQEGIVQLLSILPKSYPGHNILTEDLGQIIGEDDCPCGKKGKYFLIKGRVKDAELRGCSDVS